MAKKQPRPKIPPQVQQELWGRAAGRCEFRGCNKLLYKDSVTQQRSNLAQISHIIAFSPDGPRGHPTLSKQLEIEISNLMLTCRDHAKLIDDKTLEGKYPVDLLRSFKHEHERRIRMLTEAKEEAQTHVLLLQVPIDAQVFEIDHLAAFRAILPKYPAEEAPRRIDLSGMTLGSTSNGFFEVAARSITRHVNSLRQHHSDERRIRNLSIFALAPVPLLIHFGHCLGDFEQVDLYQRHRGSQDWTWKEEEEPEKSAEWYQIVLPSETEDDGRRKIALVLSVSALIMPTELEQALGEKPLTYELRIKEPGVDFLKSKKRLEVFGEEARKLLELLSRLDHDRTIHLFPAVPAPAAIELGRSIKAHHPPFLAYEYDKSARKRLPALLINSRVR